jgi:hypothetical protein
MMRGATFKGEHMHKILLILFAGLAVLTLAGCETTGGGSKYSQPPDLRPSNNGGP